ncbi:hypothetical protein B5181_37540, partial [Streptomyces sp. 4F]
PRSARWPPTPRRGRRREPLRPPPHDGGASHCPRCPRCGTACGCRCSCCSPGPWRSCRATPARTASTTSRPGRSPSSS